MVLVNPELMYDWHISFNLIGKLILFNLIDKLNLYNYYYNNVTWLCLK